MDNQDVTDKMINVNLADLLGNFEFIHSNSPTL